MKNKHINIFKGVFFCLALLMNVSSVAQSFEPYLIPVSDNNGIKVNAWAGGMTAPQFSEVDINGDGFMDLYHFDKDGRVHVASLNNGVQNQVSYTIDPLFTKNFPVCSGWVNLKDFNEDGIEDLFTFNTDGGVSGIRVFKGFYNTDGELDFVQYFNSYDGEPYLVFASSLSPNAFVTNLYATEEDYPAFVDLDYDGDLDILNFGSDGTYVKWYENVSDNPEELEFILGDFCLGGFAEGSLSQEIFLNLTDSMNCVVFFNDSDDISAQPLHPGSTLLAFDEDGDVDYDLLIGDVTNSNIVFLRNNGSIDNAWMTELDPTYPDYDVPVDVSPFPVAFYQDFDNDGEKDLMATNFNDNGVENYNMTWFYKNMDSNSNPIFELQSETILTDQMLDFGTFSAPVFLDYNADGLMDILVGTRGLFIQNGENPALILLENTGTASEPAYELVNNDYLNLSIYTDEYNFAPCTGDMDDDGDMDIIVGTNKGTLIYIENKAGAGMPFDFETPQVEWKGLDVGQNSAPFTIDLDRDGDLDLVVGERAGNLNFIKNIGTSSSAEFDSDLNSDNNDKNLGGVDATDNTNSIQGNSAPYFFEINGAYELVVGAESGEILRYTDIESNGDYTQLGSLELTSLGRNIMPTFADINGNGRLELLLGNHRGGLSLMSSDWDANFLINSVDVLPMNTLETSVYPNPVKETINVYVDSKETIAKVGIYDLSGKLLLESTNPAVNCKSLNAGIYIVEVSATSGLTGFSRFIKQ